MDDSPPPCVIVTGATGFVGSNLVRRLIQEGWRVHIIIRPTSSLDQVSTVKERASIYTHDGSTEGIVTIIQQVKPTIVIHLASMFISDHRTQDVIKIIQSNLLFGVQLLDAMKAAGTEYFLNTGTSWQHFQNKDYCPVNLYAATKQAFEDILKYYIETAGIKAITLKLFDTYGPADHRSKLMNLLISTGRSGEQLALSPGEQLIDLVYVDDVVEAFIEASKRLLAGKTFGHEIFSISSGKPISLRELVNLVGKILNKDLNVQWGGRPYRAREVMVPWHLGNPLPGWNPRIELPEGIQSVCQ